MDLIAGITAASEAIKLTKELRGIDREIDKAELKLRLVELADRLLDAKQALQDAKETERDPLAQIAHLKDAIQRRDSLVDEKGRLYETNENGERKGEPFCNLCFVKEDKLYRMRFMPRSEYTAAHYWCDNCRNEYYE